MSENLYEDALPHVKRENSILGFQKYIYKSHENTQELFQLIKNSQVDEIGCRFNTWRMSMGIFDFRSEWLQKVQLLEYSRKAYSDKRNSAFGLTKQVKNGKETALRRNPLMTIMQKPAENKSANQDEFLREQIKKDVDRTYQEMDFFLNQKILKLLTNILYVWCKGYPQVSYKQGMNQIGASLVYVYFQSAHFEKKNPDNYHDVSAEVQDAYHLMNSLQYAEADIYNVFDQIMNVQKEMYKTEAASTTKGVINPNSKNNTPILQRISDIKDHKLKMLDLDLFRAIKMQDVQTKSFMLRWIRCMHTREFSLFNSFLIWDSIFLDYYQSPSGRQNCIFEFVDSMCVAMFIYMRSLVLSRETKSEILQIYQKYPSLQKGKYLEQLISLAWSLCEALRNQHNIKSNWYQQSTRSNKLHFLDKGQIVQQKEVKKAEEPEPKIPSPKVVQETKPVVQEQNLFFTKKNTAPVKVQKVEKVRVKVQQQSESEKQLSEKDSPSKQEKERLFSAEDLNQTKDGHNFNVIFEPSEWKEIDELLRKSIKLNEDIQSKSLSNKVLRILEAKIRLGENRNKKEPLF